MIKAVLIGVVLAALSALYYKVRDFFINKKIKREQNEIANIDSTIRTDQDKVSKDEGELNALIDKYLNDSKPDDTTH